MSIVEIRNLAVEFATARGRFCAIEGATSPSTQANSSVSPSNFTSSATSIVTQSI